MLYKIVSKFPIKNNYQSFKGNFCYNLLSKRNFTNIITSYNELKSKYDVIIIGAGHNGLVAANYLAKFSNRKLNICILEQRGLIGGAAVTEELYPCHKFSRCSYLLSLFRPIIIEELKLNDLGMLKYYIRNPSSYTPLLPDDIQYDKINGKTSLTLGQDPKLNYQEIVKFSLKDAKNYGKYEDKIGEICKVMENLLDVIPINNKDFRESSLLEKLDILKTYFKNFKTMKFYGNNFEDIFRLFAEPASTILDEWFESDVLKATIATDSVIGAMMSPYTSGSAYILLHHVIGGINGKKGTWAYVEGGMGSVSNCLASNLKTFKNGSNVDIFVNLGVERIEYKKLNDSVQVKGVTLKNGKFIEGEYVMSNCTPHITFRNLINEEEVLSNNQNEDLNLFFKRIKKIDYESGTMKINLAIKGLPNFSANPSQGISPMPHHQTTIHFNCENMIKLDEAFKDAKLKNIPSQKPMVEMVIPSVLDPTLTPDRSTNVALLFCQYFPKTNDQNEKDKYVNLVFDAIENYAPGFKNQILFKDVLTASELENEFGLTGGNIFHGSLPLNQLFFNRPVSGWSQYQTPIKNLWLCGAGVHPGGGVMGSPGRLAALELLKKKLNVSGNI